MLHLKNTIIFTCNSIQHTVSSSLFAKVNPYHQTTNDKLNRQFRVLSSLRPFQPQFFPSPVVELIFSGGASWILFASTYLCFRPLIGDTLGWVLTSGDLASRLLSDGI